MGISQSCILRAGRSSRVLEIEKELQSVDLEVLCTPALPRMQSAQQLRKGSPCCSTQQKSVSTPTAMECAGVERRRAVERAAWRRWRKADWRVWPVLLHLCEGCSVVCLLHGTVMWGRNLSKEEAGGQEAGPCALPHFREDPEEA